MESVITGNLIALLIVITGNRLKLRNLLPLAIVFLIFFYGIRTYYGNDFIQYYTGFNQINSISGILAGNVQVWEPGWKLVNKAFAPLGFQSLVFFLTAIQFIAIGWTINRYVPRQYQIFILTIYLFMPWYMLFDLSAMRQSLVISLMLLSLPFIEKGKWIPFILMVALGATIHVSAWVCLIFPFLYKIRNIRWYALVIVFGIGLLLVFMMPRVFVNFLTLTVTQFSAHYALYLKANDVPVVATGFGIALQAVMGLYMAWILRYKSTKFRFFIICYFVGFGLMPLGQIVSGIIRIRFYFSQMGLFAYIPIIQRSSKDPLAMLILLGYGIYVLKDFVEFFYSPVFGRWYMNYHTILTFY